MIRWVRGEGKTTDRRCFKYQASFPLACEPQTHFRSSLLSLRSFSNDDRDVNENGKKAIGLLSKTTSLHRHHVFLYISLQSLHDYDVKMPNFTFYGGRKQAMSNFSFSF